jgi:hypothetical protein
MSPDELVTRVSERAKEKAQRYAGGCGGVDLLVYVNLRGRHIFPLQPLPRFSVEARACWRSVSVIMEYFAAVFWAADNAPAFLVQGRGQAFRWDKGLDSVFPKLAD